MKKLFSTSLFMLIYSLILFTGCSEDELPDSIPEKDDYTIDLPIELSEKEYTTDNTYYLLNDDEPDEVYFNSSQRSFYVNRPLQLSLEEEHYFQLRFYSPRAISHVTIWAKIEGYNEDFKFLELEKVQPFQQLRIQIPFATKDMKAISRSGKQIRIIANPHLSASNISFEVECNDPYYQKITSSLCNWRIYFSGYSGEGSWKYKLLPPHTREAVAIALNMSYMFSSEAFEEALHEFGPLHSDSNKTLIDKYQLRKRVLNHSGLRFGHCSGVNGLGGGETYGLNEWCYLEHYVDDKNETHTVFHELAHCIGYGHDGNMTYEQTGPGWITLCANVYRALSLAKELPVYSRRFMHTRKNPNRYNKNDLNVPSKYIIEDPELDLLDGGLTQK